MLFPALLLLLYRKANRYKTGILALLCVASLAACVAVTHSKPAWAFYLLPTRAWELMAGSIMANLGENRLVADGKKLSPAWQSLAGLALIAISLFSIHEGPAFPGYRAILPVLGTVCILGYKGGSSGWAERFLSTPPMVFIGRMSYSLYLWHWPIFCFVDYKLYLASPLLRMGLKAVFTAAASALCYFFIERPGRVFLNRPGNRRIAFAFLACALMICVPLGIYVRRTNFIDASAKNVARGGIALNQAGRNGSIILMGDSSGSMYGVMLKKAAQTLDYKLNIISVSDSDPLPHATGNSSQLWQDSLAFVKRENPDVVVLACSWLIQAHAHGAVIEPAISELRKHTRRLILMTQPPRLPATADRESVRNGSRPPFFEDSAERAERTSMNALVKSFEGGNVTVIDVEPLFTAGDGSIRFAGEGGILLYQDAGHLSGAGADLVKADLIQAIKN
jgi:ribosomal protein L21E